MILRAARMGAVCAALGSTSVSAINRKYPSGIALALEVAPRDGGGREILDRLKVRRRGYPCEHLAYKRT
jgi:hypothetical protein